MVIFRTNRQGIPYYQSDGWHRGRIICVHRALFGMGQEERVTWQDQPEGILMNWLLEVDNPEVRYLTLRDLLDKPESDPELKSSRRIAHTQGPIADILEAMHPEGYWAEPGPGYNPKYRSTVWTITLLAQLGGRIEEDERIQRACVYLLEHNLSRGGQFSINGTPSGTIDCLQGNLCWAMLELGFDDPRLDLANEWMARTVTGDGLAPRSEKSSERRYYAGKCGPMFACGANYNLPCAWGAAKVMLAFARLPDSRRTPLIHNAIHQGVDFLLSIDPVKAEWPSGGSDKPSSNWWKFGFPVFYVTDILQVVEALVGLGYANDPRLSNAIQFIRNKQDEQGRWLLEYDYTGKTWIDFGAKKQPNKWVTLRALRVLKKVG